MSNVVRGLGVFLVYFFLASPIAAIFLVIAAYASSPAPAADSASTTMLMYVAFSLVLAYSLGALSSMATGLIAAFSSKWIGPWWLWVALCAAVGAGLTWLFSRGNNAQIPFPQALLETGLLLFGGLASAICALICVAFRPRKAPPKIEATPAGSA